MDAELFLHRNRRTPSGDFPPIIFGRSTEGLVHISAFDIWYWSLLPDGHDGDIGNEDEGGVHVTVARRARANSEEVALAEMFGDAIQSPTGEGHVSGGEGDRQLLWWCILAVVVIGPEAVVEELARVKALPIPIAQDELDAGTVLVGDLDTGVGSELTHDGSVF
jgi:hypothetical protein